MIREQYADSDTEKNETMVIGHDIRVEVLGIKGAQVKIGIHAPEEVRILRDELLEKPMRPDNKG